MPPKAFGIKDVDGEKYVHVGFRKDSSGESHEVWIKMDREDRDKPVDTWTGDPTVETAPSTSAPQNEQVVGPAPYGQGRDTSGTVVGADTVVDTEAIRHVRRAVGELEGPVREALARLGTVDIRAGAFYHAFQLRQVVCGEDSGQVATFGAVLKLIAEGLIDLQNGLGALIALYESTEDDATVRAADVQRLMGEAGGDFAGVGAPMGAAPGGGGLPSPPPVTPT